MLAHYFLNEVLTFCKVTAAFVRPPEEYLLVHPGAIFCVNDSLFRSVSSLCQVYTESDAKHLEEKQIICFFFYYASFAAGLNSLWKIQKDMPCVAFRSV